MRKFNLFVIGVALVLFVVSFAFATNEVDLATKDCFQLPTASTKIC